MKKNIFQIESNSVLVFCLWILILEYSIYFISNNLIDKIIKISFLSIAILIFFYSKDRLNKHDIHLTMLIYGLIFSAMLPSLIKFDYQGIYQGVKFLIMASILPLALVGLKNIRINLNIYILIATLFSIQAILLFILIFIYGIGILYPVEIGRQPGLIERSLGILGYANAINNPIGNIWILRAQGWFLEPSILGAFLLFPCFTAYALSMNGNNLVYRLGLGAITVSIIITFSLAVYLAALFSFLYYILSRPLSNQLKLIKIPKYTYAIFILIIWLIFSNGIVLLYNQSAIINNNIIHNLNVGGKYDSSNEIPPLGDVIMVSVTKIFSKDANDLSGNLIREKNTIERIKNRFNKNMLNFMLGSGLSDTSRISENNSANAVFFWFNTGGILSLIIIACLSILIFIRNCHPLLMGEDVVGRVIGASFMGSAVHNLSYGNFLAPFFLANLAIVVIYSRQKKYLLNRFSIGQSGSGRIL